MLVHVCNVLVWILHEDMPFFFITVPVKINPCITKFDAFDFFFFMVSLWFEKILLLLKLQKINNLKPQ